QDVLALSARVAQTLAPTLSLRNQLQFNHVLTEARETGANNVGTYDAATGAFTPLPTAAQGNATALPYDQLYVKLASHDRRIDDESLFDQLDLRWCAQTGPVAHDLIGGVELGRDTYSNQAYTRSTAAGYLAVVPLLNPPYLPQPANTVTTAGNVATANAGTFGVYANDTVAFTPQWKLVAGVRWDQFRANLANSVNSTNTAGNTSVPAASQSVHFTSVRIGGLYQPDAVQSYYVSYGTSFNPSLEQLTLTTGQQNLDPEKNRSYEVGAKFDLNDQALSLATALFRTEKTDARSLVSTGVYALDGDVRVQGAEISASGRLTGQWQLLAGYTWLDAQIVQASAADATQGHVPANTPRHTAVLWSAYNITPAWEAGGGVNFMSARYASNTNTVSAGSFARFDATVAYHQPHYDLRVNLLNLADRTYYAALIPSDAGRSVPGIGRTALLTATYKF
ncbi:MAG TPA: TonB-dependent receptor, partial [Nevskiaceae bacterium]|nr:TonB-dependent receptor [Nevskiaceae bacterium]